MNTNLNKKMNKNIKVLNQINTEDFMNILIVDKTGKVVEKKIKGDFSEELAYKYAGFKVSTHFEKQHTWKIQLKKENTVIYLSLYAKTKGRSNIINKFECPPPLDNTILYGSMILVKSKEDGTIIPLFKSQWETYYEALYGGFEDLGSEDTDDDDDEEEDEEEIPKHKLTKDGYMKDDFVVGEDEEDDKSENEEVEEEEDTRTYMENEEEDEDENKTYEEDEEEEEENNSYLQMDAELYEDEYTDTCISDEEGDED